MHVAEKDESRDREWPWTGGAPARVRSRNGWQEWQDRRAGPRRQPDLVEDFRA
jgi:hypothetical protein